VKVSCTNKLKKHNGPAREKRFSEVSHLGKHVAKQCEKKVSNCLEEKKNYMCETCPKVLTSRSGEHTQQELCFCTRARCVRKMSALNYA
jgi:hypothetical protein